MKHTVMSDTVHFYPISITIDSSDCLIANDGVISYRLDRPLNTHQGFWVISLAEFFLTWGVWVGKKPDLIQVHCDQAEGIGITSKDYELLRKVFIKAVDKDSPDIYFDFCSPYISPMKDLGFDVINIRVSDGSGSCIKFNENLRVKLVVQVKRLS